VFSFFFLFWRRFIASSNGYAGITPARRKPLKNQQVPVAQADPPAGTERNRAGGDWWETKLNPTRGVLILCQCAGKSRMNVGDATDMPGLIFRLASSELSRFQFPLSFFDDVFCAVRSMAFIQKFGGDFAWFFRLWCKIGKVPALGAQLELTKTKAVKEDMRL
jgi:hypothetical protein